MLLLRGDNELDIERGCRVGVTFTDESDDLLVVHVRGTFTFDDLQEFQNKARDKIDRTGKVKLLLLAEQFAGWGKEGDWGNLTFMYEYDPFIEKMAVVADHKWRDQILMFVGAGRRQASVRFFLSDEEEFARDWLQGKSVNEQ